MGRASCGCRDILPCRFRPVRLAGGLRDARRARLRPVCGRPLRRGTRRAGGCRRYCRRRRRIRRRIRPRPCVGLAGRDDRRLRESNGSGGRGGPGRHSGPMRNQAQLIAYVDRCSGGVFRDLQRLLEGPLRAAFGGVHLLPFFDPIDGADAGFDPIDHTAVDPRVGSWDDVRALASRTDIMADMIVNHISRWSPQFTDFDARGDASPYAGLFLTFSRVFPRGASDADLLALHAIRPGLPFTGHRTAHGEHVLLWTTFTSEQVDIDVHHREGQRNLDAILARFEEAGIRAIRIDAAGFAVKKAGTSCFMIPETLAFIADLTARARARGLEVLVEMHGHYLDQARIATQVDWVYDFALPPLLLHTLYTRDATSLRKWIDIRPANSITVLDTHDGIGVLDAGPGGAIGDERPGLLTLAEIRAL